MKRARPERDARWGVETYAMLWGRHGAAPAAALGPAVPHPARSAPRVPSGPDLGSRTAHA
ncbi:hypothetical protein LV779_25745 [Streptomyces thinghirensis]|nr:hypothetical protein [Streptomyces thinghirensis]